jgi:signal transduction histidine kinase
MSEATAADLAPYQFLAGRLTRSSDDRVIAGLAGGVGARLGIPSVYVRAALVSLALAGGVGVILYLIGWIGTPDDEQYGSLITAERPASARQRVGLGLVFIAALLVLESVGLWFGGVVWPATLLGFGAALMWDRSSAQSRDRLANLAKPPGAGESRSRAQIVLGAMLMAAGTVVILTSLDTFQALGPVAIAVLLTAVGFMLVFGPWVWRLFDNLSAERRARIRSEERAEMAAHLHDSVLQTLAMIQRSDDPQHMTTLARAQERDLRSWLFATEREHPGETVGEAVAAAAAKVETAFDVPIEVVVVGDRPATGDSAALVAAAGEAMSNAAGHSGARQISVYVECTPETVEAWITDQGIGFEPATVGDDRKGIAESIIARMERSGGSADLVSRLGEGTEVHLRIGAT